MSKHIERDRIPENADEERTHLNKELVEFPQGVENRSEAIAYRIEHADIKRKIGSNQVRAIRIILSGSAEDMKRIQENGLLDGWCNDSLDWVRETFGKENLISAVLHMDEATPHIHATIVPIVTGERKSEDINIERGTDNDNIRKLKKGIGRKRLIQSVYVRMM